MFNIFQPTVPTISAEEVHQAINKKEQLILIDVRTPEEFSKNRITGSINVPIDELVKRIKKIAPDQKQKTYVYCFSGARSMAAVEIMTKLGYTNVFSMTSGLLAWRSKKYPLEA